MHASKQASGLYEHLFFVVSCGTFGIAEVDVSYVVSHRTMTFPICIFSVTTILIGLHVGSRHRRRNCIPER
jgi:hypothetical protein